MSFASSAEQHSWFPVSPSAPSSTEAWRWDIAKSFSCGLYGGVMIICWYLLTVPLCKGYEEQPVVCPGWCPSPCHQQVQAGPGGTHCWDAAAGAPQGSGYTFRWDRGICGTLWCLQLYHLPVILVCAGRWPESLCLRGLGLLVTRTGGTCEFCHIWGVRSDPLMYTG